MPEDERASIPKNGGKDHDEVVRMGETVGNISESIQRMSDALSKFQLEAVSRIVALEAQRNEERHQSAKAGGDRSRIIAVISVIIALISIIVTIALHK